MILELATLVLADFLAINLKADPAKVTMNREKAGNNEVTNPLWITYSWADNEEGDFDYLIQELERAAKPLPFAEIFVAVG